MEIYLINQGLLKNTELDNVIYQRAKSGIKSDINKKIFFRVKYRFQFIIRLIVIKSQRNFLCYLSFSC